MPGQMEGRAVRGSSLLAPGRPRTLGMTRVDREDDSCWYYQYDGLQRLTAADWKDSGGASIYAYEYAYDKVGNRTHIVENGVPTYYQHNPANELTRIGWVDDGMIGWLEFGAWAGSRLAEREASAHSAHSSIHPSHPFIQQASICPINHLMHLLQ